MKTKIKKYMTTTIIFGIVFSITTWIGKALYEDATMRDNVSSAMDVFVMFCQMLLLFFVGMAIYIFVTFIFESILRYCKDKPIKMNDTKMFFMTFLGLFICWFPVYLAFYPGADSYDFLIQILQVTGEMPYRSAHPICHTLLLKICYVIGNEIPIANFGLVIYSMLQMLIMAVFFGYTFVWLKRRGMGKVLLTILIVFYAFCPTIVLLMFSPTKDVLFSGFFLMWILNLADMLDCRDDISNKAIAKYIIWGELSCLFRNNAILSIGITSILLFLVFRKAWKKVVIMAAAVIGIYLLFNIMVSQLFGIEGNPKYESLSIPMNQIAAVVANENGNYTQEEYDLAYEFLPMAEEYNPRLADVVKWSFNNQLFVQDESNFYSLWFQLLKKNPGIYAETFINLNMPMWYVNNPFPDKYANRWYIDVGQGSLDGRVFMPAVRQIYTELGHFPEWLKKIPVVGWLFSLSASIWILFLCDLFLIIKKRKKLAFVSMPVLIFWVSYLFGAVSCFRYMFPIVVFLPVYISIIWLELQNKRGIENENSRN